MSPTWLPLTEYSSKHKVSISTLRRRIKAKDIKYQLREGRYLIADEPVTEEGAFQGHQVVPQHRPSLKDATTASSPSPKLDSLIGTPANAAFSQTADEPILTAANRLLSELKKAYTQILQEKEEQILNLKEEVTDLKTLVRVLESENLRLQR